MERLEVKVVVTFPAGWLFEAELLDRPKERVLWSSVMTTFDPDCLNKIIPHALQAAQGALGMQTLGELKPLTPEVSVALNADEGECRPALHLTAQTISLMSDAGATLDFDPYCS